MKRLIISTVMFYRNHISIMKLPTCRFYPTCSQYALDAVEKKGVLKGLLSLAGRILRCNPFFRGGYDPVK